MSSLWTPGGEHPVEPPPEDPSAEDQSPEDRERAEDLVREMAAVQEQLAAAPAAVVVANHVMGFYELAAIHLSQQSANLLEAAVAIDAMAGVVEKLPGRLGEAESTLREALHQIRMAYVGVEQANRAAAAETDPSGGDSADGQEDEQANEPYEELADG